MRALKSEQSGAAMVEFAIVAPLLFLLVFGLIDFSRAYFLYNNLTNAARDGARIAAVTDWAAVGGVAPQVRSRIRDADALTAGSVRVVRSTDGDPLCPATPARSVCAIIENYPFETVTPALLPMLRNIRLRTTAQFRHEFS